MTNEELLSVAEIVERATNRFNAHAAYHRERFDEHVKLIASMKADHEAKMVEHRAAFGARTEADAKIIAGLREESAKHKAERDHFYQREGIEQKRRIDSESERDGLLTQVQDMRAEMERLKLACSTYAADWATAGNACRMRDNEYPLGAVIRLVRDDAERAEVAKRLVAERDALRAEVADLRGIVDMVHASLGIKRGDHIGNAIAQLKAQTPKRSHPVAVGEYLRRLTGFSTTPAGEVAQVLHVDCDAPTTEYTVKRPNGQQGVWSESGCEPCDPPEATHDTDAGKASAESAVRTEPVAEGDLVKVFQANGSMTDAEDIGSGGVVHKVDGFVWLDRHYAMGLPREGIASLSDVRKVTT